MATLDAVTFNLSADTTGAMKAVRLLKPLVWLGLIGVNRAVAIAMKFVRVSVTPVAR